MKQDPDSFLRTVRSPLKFKLFLWTKLPLAALAGLRIVSVNKERAILRTQCWWLTQNPFKSTFWAVMGMAAEMCSGLLVTMYAGRKCAMYVTACKAEFNKRAVGYTFYTCHEGAKIKAVIDECIAKKTTAVIDCVSVVTNETGDTIATFTFTWSIKARS
jgi:hypothetical protein